MDQPFDISRLLVLRKVTRGISDLFGARLRRYLGTLSVLIQPRNVFGEHIRSTAKQQSIKGADEAFEQLRGLYMALADASPFNLPRELESPLDVFSTVPEVTPAEYSYVTQVDGQERTISVTSPLKWVLTYSGSSPRRLRELLANQDASTTRDVQHAVLHYLVMHVTLLKRPGVTQILEGLRVPVSAGRMEEFGELPVRFVECPISTIRPPDDVIIQSTEISGTPAFEEVVNIENIVNLQDPLREQLLEVVKSHGEGLLEDVS